MHESLRGLRIPRRSEDVSWFREVLYGNPYLRSKINEILTGDNEHKKRIFRNLDNVGGRNTLSTTEKDVLQEVIQMLQEH
jgi:tRNA C32,U32 (ribose-2'-O)-methylase TrmJ